MTANFFQRWSSRKLTASNPESIETSHINQTDIEETTLVENGNLSEDLNTEVQQSEQVSDSSDETSEVAEQQILTLDDIAKVSYESGVASFMQDSVDKSVKKAALHKLFHSSEFNYISDMDDCTADFSNIEGLDTAIASQLRGWVNDVVEKVEAVVDFVEKNDDKEKLALDSSQLAQSSQQQALEHAMSDDIENRDAIENLEAKQALEHQSC